MDIRVSNAKEVMSVDGKPTTLFDSYDFIGLDRDELQYAVAAWNVHSRCVDAHVSFSYLRLHLAWTSNSVSSRNRDVFVSSVVEKSSSYSDNNVFFACSR